MSDHLIETFPDILLTEALWMQVLVQMVQKNHYLAYEECDELKIQELQEKLQDQPYTHPDRGVLYIVY